MKFTLPCVQWRIWIQVLRFITYYPFSPFSGIYYRISGGDPSGRSGRAEIFFDDEWGTLCNTDWGENEASALCRQMGFHGGDPIDGPFKVPAKGLVYRSMYQCSATSQSLRDCPHSGWQEAKDTECTDHQNDAGLFCYQNGENTIWSTDLKFPFQIVQQHALSNEICICSICSWINVLMLHWNQCL